jgi:DNA-binding beta-propeller fold protein YncE
MLLAAALAALLAGLATAAAPVAPTEATTQPQGAASKGLAHLFWPAPPETPRVQLLRAISTAADVTGQAPAADAEKKPLTERPYGVRLAGGCLYVCDAVAAQVLVLDLAKKEVRKLGDHAAPALTKPIDLALAPDGTRYVADTGLSAVLVFDKDDKYAGKITLQDARPVAVAVHDQELLVADLKASAIRVFARETGKELRTIAPAAEARGTFGGATGVATDAAGAVYFADVIGCRLRKFAADGTQTWCVGGVGAKPGQFTRPKHLAVDSAGSVYVVDNALGNVQVFDKQGQCTMFFGATGQEPASAPCGIALSEDPKDIALFAAAADPAFDIQRLAVIAYNTGPVKLTIYALGQLKPGKTAADLAPARVSETRP